MVETECAGTLVSFIADMKAFPRLHTRAQFNRDSVGVDDPERPCFERSLDPGRLVSLGVEIDLGPIEIGVLEDSVADCSADRLVAGSPEDQAVMTNLLNTAQVGGIGILIADGKADHFGVEFP
jgi:hypothetical protein